MLEVGWPLVFVICTRPFHFVTRLAILPASRIFHYLWSHVPETLQLFIIIDLLSTHAAAKSLKNEDG